MTTLTIDIKHADILQSFGNLEEIVEKALYDYAIKRINERIEKYQQEAQLFETKYGMPYESFFDRIMSDDEFVKNLWGADPTWKTDLPVWKYYAEGLAEWHGRLKNIYRVAN